MPSLGHNELTHDPLDNMAAISQTIFLGAFSLMKSFFILIKIWLKFILKGPIYNNSALVQIIAWHWISIKLSSEPILTWFTDAYICHKGEMS